ncbi:cation diffusion facilitator family transporter [Membranihabitans maritimus]|uniref:cation diffusion facilitator family transporter n=1 Tax=Membranihabitans maritimus TaxID=2904244 RepID=UPI001F03121E|nr:cation transporter [Membranihabitans maritimus]
MKKNNKQYELPSHLQPVLKKSKKLEWITLIYICSVIILMYSVMGSSQAMKTAWIEDVLSLLPAISFLVASNLYSKAPTNIFPYGYHRVFSIAFLTGSVALFSMGIYLFIDSTHSLWVQDRPTIGAVTIFENQFWEGWIMIAALAYSSLPSIVLGYMKQPLAKKLHNKILFIDAKTQKADYLTAFAAMIGIMGVGAGFWWADAATALFISVSVTKDGYQNLSNAVGDLMDRRPVQVNSHKKDELVEKIAKEVESWIWVKNSRVRFREHGQVYFGEVYIIPNSNEISLPKIEEGINKIKELHWKIHDVTIMQVSCFSPNSGSD